MVIDKYLIKFIVCFVFMTLTVCNTFFWGSNESEGKEIDIDDPNYSFPSPYSEESGIYYWSDSNVGFGSSFVVRINEDKTWSSVVHGFGSESSDYGVIEDGYLKAEKMGEYLYGGRRQRATVGQVRVLKKTDAKVIRYLGHLAYKKGEEEWYNNFLERIKNDKIKRYLENSFYIIPLQLHQSINKEEKRFSFLFADEVEVTKEGFTQRIDIYKYEYSKLDPDYEWLDTFFPDGSRMTEKEVLLLKNGKLYSKTGEAVAEVEPGHYLDENNELQIDNYSFIIRGNNWYDGHYN